MIKKINLTINAYLKTWLSYVFIMLTIILHNGEILKIIKINKDIK